MVTGRTGKGLGRKGEEMGDNQKTLYVCKKFSNNKKNILGSLGREFQMSSKNLRWYE